MGIPHRRAGKLPRHRAALDARWLGVLAAHPWYAALTVVCAGALAGGLTLLPGHDSPPTASGCGLVACTYRGVAPAAATGESGASLRGAAQAPARATVAPAQPGGAIGATPSPSPTQVAPHHGHARGIAHRRHGLQASTG